MAKLLSNSDICLVMFAVTRYSPYVDPLKHTRSISFSRDVWHKKTNMAEQKWGKKITWRETECPRKSFGRGPTPWRRVGFEIGGMWGRPFALGVCSRQQRTTACVKAHVVGLKCIHDIQLTGETDYKDSDADNCNNINNLKYHKILRVIGV
jgi:hypothetical protein